MLQRLWHIGAALLLAGTGLLLLGRWAGRAAAMPSGAHFNIDNPSDLPDDDLSDGLCQAATSDSHKCTLRAALQQLNHDAGGSVNLPANLYNLTDDASGDLQLQKFIAIYGSGPGLSVVQGNPAGWAHRIFRVQNNAQVLLSGLTISGGNVPTGNGGGLDVVSGFARLTDVVVMDNQAGQGGGIFDGDDLDLEFSTVRDNHAFTNGGGLYDDDAAHLNATLVRTTLFNNSAANQGGGAYNAGVMTVDDSQVQQNVAGDGAGLLNTDAGLLTVTRSTLFANHTSGFAGGGLENASSAARLALVNSTLTGNQATRGGGLEVFAGTADLSSDTLAANSATASGAAGGGIEAGAFATVTLRNSIVALNLNPGGSAPDCAGSLASRGYNLFGNIAHCGVFDNLTGNLSGEDPGLFGLANYGGPTLTMALKLNSPAVEAGNPAGCKDGQGHTLATDQRGDLRSFDGDQHGGARCDMGAFELQWVARLFQPLLVR